MKTSKSKMIQTVLLFILGLILICLGGDRLVDAAVAIAKKLGIPEIVVGATIVSLGTTLPEILVSTTAAFDGSAAIAAGNACGSIICNTALIAGLTPTIRWRGIFFFAVLIGMNLYAYLTQKFNRPAGIVLILLFAVYAYLNIKKAGSEGEESENGEDGKKEGGPIWKHLLVLVVCAVLLYFGANLLVDNGILIAEALGVPERVIAVTFIALGTSLPELVTSLVSIIKGYGNVGLGNSFCNRRYSIGTIHGFDRHSACLACYGSAADTDSDSEEILQGAGNCITCHICGILCCFFYIIHMKALRL